MVGKCLWYKSITLSSVFFLHLCQISLGFIGSLNPSAASDWVELFHGVAESDLKALPCLFVITFIDKCTTVKM